MPPIRSSTAPPHPGPHPRPSSAASRRRATVLALIGATWLWLLLSGAGVGASDAALGSAAPAQLAALGPTSFGHDPADDMRREQPVDDMRREQPVDDMRREDPLEAAPVAAAAAAFIAAGSHPRADDPPNAPAAGPLVDSPDTPYPECPDGMASLGRACIDRWEAHLVRIDDHGNAEPWPHYQRPERRVRYEARTGPGVFPQGYISRTEADRACKSAGKRLCTLNEWRSACEGKKRSTYPVGTRGKSKGCNSAKPHLLEMYFGRSASLWKYDEHFNNPILNQQEGWLARTGDYADCVSDEGVYDLVGNLHEWVSDTVDHHFKARMDAEAVARRKQSWRSGNGAFLGGFFSTRSQLGPGCMFTTIAHEPAYHDYSTGFRCCQNPIGVESPSAKPKKKRRSSLGE